MQGTQLKIVFNINEQAGIYSTTMDSPDQGAKDIPTDSTTLIDGELTIQLATLITGKEIEVSRRRSQQIKELFSI